MPKTKAANPKKKVVASGPAAAAALTPVRGVDPGPVGKYEEDQYELDVSGSGGEESDTPTSQLNRAYDKEEVEKKAKGTKVKPNSTNVKSNGAPSKRKGMPQTAAPKAKTMTAPKPKKAKVETKAAPKKANMNGDAEAAGTAGPKSPKKKVTKPNLPKQAASSSSGLEPRPPRRNASVLAASKIAISYETRPRVPTSVKTT